MKYIKNNNKVYFILIFIIVLAACQNSEDHNEIQEEVEKYTNLYEEREITLPTDYQVVSIQKASDDLFVASYKNIQNNTYHLGYTDSKFTSMTPILNDASNLVDFMNLHTNESSEYMIGMTPVYFVHHNSRIYLLQYEVQQDLTNPFDKKVIFVYDKDGTLLDKIPIESPKQISPMPPNSIIAQDNRFIIIYETGIQIVDLQGSTIKELAVPSDKAVDVINQIELIQPVGRIINADVLNENELVFIQDKGGHYYLTSYDLTDQKELWSQEFNEDYRPLKIHVDERQHNIYVISLENIVSFHTDGTEIGEVINFNDYVAGEYSSSVFNKEKLLNPGYLTFEDPDNMIVYMIGSPLEPQIKKVFLYRKLLGDEKAKQIEVLKQREQERTIITLFVPYVEGGLIQKIAHYEKMNPNIKVNLTYYRSNIEEFNRQDYEQFINLQLFTNRKQWDVLAVQLLPYRNYIRQGYFAEMDQIDPKRQIEKIFFPNIIEAARIDGKLSFIPARIAMRVNLADKHAAKDLDPLNYKWKDLFQISNKAKQQNSAIKSWSLSNRSPYSEVIQSYQPDLITVGGDKEIQKQLISEFLDTMKVLSVPDDSAIPPDEAPLFQTMLFLPTQFPYYIDLIGSEKLLLPSPASPISGKHSFTLQEGYAINKESHVKEESLKFISFLVQNAESNNLIFKKSFDHLNNDLGTTNERKEAIKQLQTVVESLDTLRDIDLRLRDALSITTEQYVNGITDKETAIRTIQDKLWLYENE